MVSAERGGSDEQDVLILLQYYDEHKPAFATREKCESVISSFKKKARAANKQAIRTQAHPDWRELMYTSITRQRGVDPREAYDLAVGTTLANGLAQRERRRTEVLSAARTVAWEDKQLERQKRETSLDERLTDSKAREVAYEREVIEKPWRHTVPQTVLVTVPPGGVAGQTLTVKLANGATIHPTIPPNCPAGHQFSAPAVPTRPDICSLGGGHRVMVDSGRNPYATQTELIAESLNPNHPSMPHIDMWHTPQFNPAPRGGLAESEYQDRYLGYWRSKSVPGLGKASSGGERDNQWLTEINDQNYFARLPESRKEPQGAAWGTETGSKRAELNRILRGANGTMAGPHAESLLDDVQTKNAQADAKLNFKSRSTTLFGQKQGQGLEVLKRYSVLHGNSSGQGCELQICRGDISTSMLDAIVAPAKPDLSAGGGANGRIHAAAGSFFARIVHKVKEISPGLRCDTGAAVATPSGELGASFVIHAVGPVHPTAPRWQSLVYTGGTGYRNDPPLGVPQKSRNYSEQQVPGLLASAYASALQVANQLNLTSVALPAISCDRRGGAYPPVEAAAIALDACLNRETLGSIELIQFVLDGAYVESAFLSAASKKVRFNIIKAQSSSAGGQPNGGDDTLSEDQLRLITAFKKFDTNGDGKISPQEFRHGINSMDIELPGNILVDMVNKLCVTKLDNVWEEFDADGSGELDPKEFSEVMKLMSPSMVQADVNRLIHKLDKDKSGTISQAEFQKWFMRQGSERKEAVVSIPYEQFAISFDPFENQLRRLFNDIDEDGSGLLNRTELDRLCRDMGVTMSERELSEAMRDMDEDGSGEVDFEEFYAWWTRARKHSRKVAKAIAEFKTKRESGAVRQSVAFGRPTRGVSGAETEKRAEGGYLPHRINRKPQRSSAPITQMDPQYYDRQLHGGTLFGEPGVTVKPGQQAGAGTRESHYRGPEEQLSGGEIRDPNNYVLYKPNQEIVEEILANYKHLRPGKLQQLRRNLEGLGAADLRDRAELANVDEALLQQWWSRSGRQRQTSVPPNANEDNHYTLVPPWQSGAGSGGAGAPARGQLQSRPRAKGDLGTAEKFVDSRTCWVGGIPRRIAKDNLLAQLLESAGYFVERVTVRAKPDEIGKSNRSWALVALSDRRERDKLAQAQVTLDDDSGNKVALVIKAGNVEGELERKHSESTRAGQGDNVIGALEAVSVAHAAGGDEHRQRIVSVDYALNEGGYGAGSVWKAGYRDETGASQGRPTYSLDGVGGTDARMTKGKWVSDGQRHYIAEVEEAGEQRVAKAGGVRKSLDSWGKPQFQAPVRDKLHIHWGKRYIGRDPDEPYSGWGQERPGYPHGMRDLLKHS